MKTYFTVAMLQLLANINTNVTTQTGTGQDLSAENKTFYDRTLIRYATPNLVHAQFGQKRPIPKNGGKTIEFRSFKPLAKALTALTEGVTPDGQKMDVSAITAQVAQYGAYITQSDVLELTAIDNTIVEATKMLGNQAGLTLDTLTRNVLNSGNNVMHCPKIAANGTTTAVAGRSSMDATCRLTVDMVKRAVVKLKQQNAPKINGSYVAIIHPNVAYDLTTDPEWQEWSKYTTPEHMFEGEIGKIYGVRFVESTEAKVWNDSTCPSDGGSGKLAVFSTLFMGEGAYGITEIDGGGLRTIIKQKGSAGTADPLDQRSTIGWKAITVTELLVPQYLVRVESCSTVYSASTQAN